MLNSTWEWTRLFGFLAYFYFTISIIFGLLRKTSYIKSHKNLVYQLHQSAGWMGLFTVLFHILVLMFDSYMPYSIGEVLIPFSAAHKPLASGIGTIAFYCFLIVLMTSDLWIKTMKRAIWKNIHFIVLPAWLFSLFHGITLGSDSGNLLVLLFYAATGGAIIILSALRMINQNEKNKNIPSKNKPSI